MIKVRGTQNTVKPVTVNIDTVYLRTNITKVKEEDFDGWEYNEEQLSKDEFISKLTREQDSEMLAMMVSMLFLEVDMLKMQLGGGL